MKNSFRIGAVLVLALVSQAFAVEEFTGKVVVVHDADTVTVLHGTTQIKVRLSSIDGPEHSQPYGTKARDALAGRVHGQEVTVLSTGKDKYGRTLGHLMHNEKWVNKWMVVEGWAWHYHSFSDDERLQHWQAEAKRARKGLWADDNPVAPWEFRRAEEKARKQ